MDLGCVPPDEYQECPRKEVLPIMATDEGEERAVGHSAYVDNDYAWRNVSGLMSGFEEGSPHLSRALLDVLPPVWLRKPSTSVTFRVTNNDMSMCGGWNASQDVDDLDWTAELGDWDPETLKLAAEKVAYKPVDSFLSSDTCEYLEAVFGGCEAYGTALYALMWLGLAPQDYDRGKLMFHDVCLRLKYYGVNIGPKELMAAVLG
jgi:hypothetical protein